jgi:hypothetical protein
VPSPYRFELVNDPDHGLLVRVEDVIGYLAAAAAALRRGTPPPAPPSLIAEVAGRPTVAVPVMINAARMEALEKAAADFTALLR